MQNTDPSETIKEERDINDVFDDIFLKENQIAEQTFLEGFEEGKNRENLEAYHLGYHRGAEIGVEIGYYTSFTKRYLESCKEDQIENSVKIVKELNTLKILLGQFPTTNDPDTDILKLLTDIRAKFKKLCAILKITPVFPEPEKFSF